MAYGLYELAIADFDQAIRLNLNQATAFTHRGVVYSFKRQYDRAIEDFDQAIKLNPHSMGAETLTEPRANTTEQSRTLIGYL